MRLWARSPVRVARPTFLRDTALSLGLGAAGGVLAAVVVALAGFPEWGETLLSFLVVLAFAFVLGMTIRLFLHIGEAYVHHGFETDGPRSRPELLRKTLPFLRAGAGAASAAAVLVLAFLLGTGTTGR